MLLSSSSLLVTRVGIRLGAADVPVPEVEGIGSRDPDVLGRLLEGSAAEPAPFEDLDCELLPLSRDLPDGRSALPPELLDSVRIAAGSCWVLGLLKAVVLCLRATRTSAAGLRDESVIKEIGRAHV